MKKNFISHGNDKFPQINPNVFPNWASDYIVESQKSINCPMEYLTTVFLSMIGTSIGKSTSLQFKSQWKEYPSLYTVIIGSPSMKKTPSLNAIFLPLEEIQAKLKCDNDLAIDEYKATVSELKKEKASAETIKALKEPKEYVAYITDITMEALMDALNDNPLGILIYKDELNHLFVSLNAYKNGGGDVETLLELYGFKSAAIGRRGRDRILTVTKPFVVIAGGIQFKPFKDFFGNLENGLIERFNFSMPDENINTDYSDFETSQQTIDQYSLNVNEIYRISREIVDSRNEVVLCLSPEAKELFLEWWKTIPEESEHEAMFEKAKARALRIAIILHVLKHPKREILEIEGETMHNTLLISNYFANSYIKAVHKLNNKENEDKFNSGLNWILRQYASGRVQSYAGRRGVSVRNFQTFNNKRYKRVAAAYEFLQEMETRGYGQIAYPHKDASKNAPTLFCLYKHVLDEHGITEPSVD